MKLKTYIACLLMLVASLTARAQEKKDMFNPINTSVDRKSVV